MALHDQDRFSPRLTDSNNSFRAAMITRQAKQLFAAYRRDEFADPDGFVVQMGLVLQDYADEVIMAVTSPKTGIQRRLKWPPSIAEVVEACDAEAARLETMARYNAMPRPNFVRLSGPPRKPGCRANVFVPEEAPQYQRVIGMIEKADPLDWRWDEKGRKGVWITLGMLEDTAPKVDRTWRAMTSEELKKHYGTREG